MRDSNFKNSNAWLLAAGCVGLHEGPTGLKLRHHPQWVPAPFYHEKAEPGGPDAALNEAGLYMHQAVHVHGMCSSHSFTVMFCIANVLIYAQNTEPYKIHVYGVSHHGHVAAL